METVKAPGLKWRKLAGGLSPVWVADEADVKRGYLPRTVNLGYLADQPDILVAKANALQADMLLWRSGYRRDPLRFDGTIRSLLDVYETHEDSPYRLLKPGSLRPYKHYLRRLRGHIGSLRIDDITGVDFRRWHKIWSSDGKHLSAAAMARAVLEAAISFGITLRFTGCQELATILRESRKHLPTSRPREAVMSPEEVIALRKAAHTDGAPSRALVYAIAYEVLLRLWDVTGQWWPLDMPGISTVVDADRKEKWFGLGWEHIDANLLLTFTPSKTDGTTGKSVSFRLTNAPMVMEELQHVPVSARTGPVAISEKTGLPYREEHFRRGYNRDRKAAGISSSVWARDLRASGVTEGRAGGASIDDAGKVAAHSGTRTTKRVYDRAVLEASDRFAEARIKAREQSGNGSGNVR